MLLAACRLDAEVEVEVAEDGSGEVEVVVTLDADATAQVPDLADQLVVDDLVSAGWEVRGPEVDDAGRTAITATKGFRTPEEASEVLSEVTGPGGPVRDLRVERRTSTFETTYDLTGTVDLSAGLEAFSDDALRQRLDGTSFGLEPAELEARVGGPIAEAVGLSFVARLPGGDVTTVEAISGRSVPVRAEATVRNGRRLSLVVVAAVALALAVLLGVTGLVGAVRSTRSR